MMILHFPSVLWNIIKDYASLFQENVLINTDISNILSVAFQNKWPFGPREPW